MTTTTGAPGTTSKGSTAFQLATLALAALGASSILVVFAVTSRPEPASAHSAPPGERELRVMPPSPLADSTASAPSMPPPDQLGSAPDPRVRPEEQVASSSHSAQTSGAEAEYEEYEASEE